MPLVLNDNLTPVMIQTFCGKAIDVPNWAVEDRTPLHQWEAHRGTNQLWYLDPCGADCVRIIGRGSGRVIDVPDGQPRQVQLWAWAANGNQRWVIEETAGGEVIIALAENRDLVLDVGGVSEANGAPIYAWHRNGQMNQRFKLVR